MTNNIILEAYIKNFKMEWGLDCKDDILFEHFVNHCILSKYYISDSDHDLEDIHTGGGLDNAIDGLIILVNDHIVTSEKEIDFHLKDLNRLEVKFIFIQTKSSNKFDQGDIGNFLFGVNNFFERETNIPQSVKIARLVEVKNYIYTNLVMKLTKLPECHLYYAAMGQWNDDPLLQGRINSDIKSLKNKNIFSDTKFVTIDQMNIEKIYRELKNKTEAKIQFEKHTILPKMAGVDEAYLGILPCSEYLKIIKDDNGCLIKNLFYDNVRDFQGANPVNEEVAETIANKMDKDKFVLFNNGVTIVAKSLMKVGTTFTIRDYQIVNGCQTSHILYQNQAKLIADMFLPIKLIVTNNYDIMTKITMATNRQTPVTIEAFESLTPYQKLLEEYYKNYEITPKLYYERRSKQYDDLPVSRTQIITLTYQIKSFFGMFLNEPHSTHRYYGELLKNSRRRIFLRNHRLIIYFTSGLANNFLDNLLKTKKLDNEYRRFRYHLLMLFRINVAGLDMPGFSNRKIDDYCLKMINILKEPDKAVKIFMECIKIIDDIIETKKFSYHNADQLKKFTQELLTTKGIKLKEVGEISTYNSLQGYGFINCDYDENVFFHISNFIGTDNEIIRGVIVEFNVEEGRKGVEAKNIKIINNLD